jgi:hypothetical protein
MRRTWKADSDTALGSPVRPAVRRSAHRSPIYQLAFASDQEAKSGETQADEGGCARLGNTNIVRRELNYDVVKVADAFQVVGIARSPGIVFKSQDLDTGGQFEEREVIVSQCAQELISSRHVGAIVTRAGSVSHRLRANRSGNLIAHRCVETVDVAVGLESIIGLESRWSARGVTGNSAIERSEREASVECSGVISEHGRTRGEAGVLAAVGEKDCDVISGRAAEEAKLQGSCRFRHNAGSARRRGQVDRIGTARGGIVSAVYLGC